MAKKVHELLYPNQPAGVTKTLRDYKLTVFAPGNIWCGYFLKAFSKIFSADVFTFHVMVSEYKKAPNIILFDCIVEGFFRKSESAYAEINLSGETVNDIVSKAKLVKETAEASMSRARSSAVLVRAASASSLSSASSAVVAAPSAPPADIFDKAEHLAFSQMTDSNLRSIISGDYIEVVKLTTEAQKRDYAAARKYMKDAGIVMFGNS